MHTDPATPLPPPAGRTSPGLASRLAGEGARVAGADPAARAEILTRDELMALGHRPMAAQAALRLHCLDCCAGSATEVRLCAAVKCPSWPFRLGKSPWKDKRVLTDEQRAAASARAHQMVERRRRDIDST